MKKETVYENNKMWWDEINVVVDQFKLMCSNSEGLGMSNKKNYLGILPDHYRASWRRLNSNKYMKNQIFMIFHRFYSIFTTL